MLPGIRKQSDQSAMSNASGLRKKQATSTLNKKQESATSKMIEQQVTELTLLDSTSRDLTPQHTRYAHLKLRIGHPLRPNQPVQSKVEHLLLDSKLHQQTPPRTRYAHMKLRIDHPSKPKQLVQAKVETYASNHVKRAKPSSVRPQSVDLNQQSRSDTSEKESLISTDDIDISIMEMSQFIPNQNISFVQQLREKYSPLKARQEIPRMKISLKQYAKGSLQHQRQQSPHSIKSSRQKITPFGPGSSI